MLTPNELSIFQVIQFDIFQDKNMKTKLDTIALQIIGTIAMKSAKDGKGTK